MKGAEHIAEMLVLNERLRTLWGCAVPNMDTMREATSLENQWINLRDQLDAEARALYDEMRRELGRVR